MISLTFRHRRRRVTADGGPNGWATMTAAWLCVENSSVTTTTTTMDGDNDRTYKTRCFTDQDDCVVQPRDNNGYSIDPLERRSNIILLFANLSSTDPGGDDTDDCRSRFWAKNEIYARPPVALASGTRRHGRHTRHTRAPRKWNYISWKRTLDKRSRRRPPNDDELDAIRNTNG